MSRLTDVRQDAVTAQVNAAIEGRKPSTDPQTWYAIHQGLMADDASERQRWASKSLVPFRGRLSDDDFDTLEKLQTAVRTTDGGAEQNRLQAITRMANRALRSVGIDPTPQPDASPGSHAAQAATFHRALTDELSAFETGKGRKATAGEAYDIVSALKKTAIKSGWLKVTDSGPFASDIPSADSALHEPGAQLAEAEPSPETGSGRMEMRLDFSRLRRMREEEEQREAAERSAVLSGGANGVPATEPHPGSTVYESADAQARDIVADQTAEQSAANGSAPPTEPPPGSPEFQGAEREAGRLAERQEGDNRDTDRMITDWFASMPNDGSPPQMPTELAKRLSAEERNGIESYAARTSSRNTIPEIYDRLLSNLLNFNSQVRLKWAREPLFWYREYLSAEYFAKLARIQSRLDPHTGQVSGFAPVPADLAPLYDWLAPDPDWHYGALFASDDYGHVRPTLPPPVRSFSRVFLIYLPP